MSVEDNQDQQNQEIQNNDTYEVISEGEILPGLSKKRVSDNLQALFQKEKSAVIPLISGKVVRVKSGLTHQDAYTFLQALKEAGVKVKLNRIPAKELTPGFSLVPEGEENTPYKELAERHRKGETVICKHCNCEQQIAPYCSDCGKQLIAKTGAMPPEVTTSSFFSPVKLALYLVLVFIGIVGLWILI